MNKKFLLGLLFTFILFSCPIEANSVPIPKGFVTVLLKKLTVRAEKLGIKATNSAKKNVPRAANWAGKSALRTAPRTAPKLMRASKNSSNELSQPIVACPICHGTGYLRKSSIRVYSCNRCGGTGHILKASSKNSLKGKRTKQHR